VVKSTGRIFEKSTVVSPSGPIVTRTPSPPLRLARAVPLAARALTAVLRQVPVTQLATGPPRMPLAVGVPLTPLAVGVPALADGEGVAESSTHPARTRPDTATVSRVIAGVRSRIGLPPPS
jgi:hypothetical protein